MLKVLFLCSFIYCNCSLVANEFPEVIDFGKFHSIKHGYYSSYEQEAFDSGLYAFNYAPNLAPFSNISCFLGDSIDVLQTLLPALQDKRLLFYLDAHWDKEKFPLYEELRIIAKRGLLVKSIC